jgi:orotate phosphoribosyltransferase
MKNELIELLCRKSFKYSETPAFKLVFGPHEPVLRQLQTHDAESPRHVSHRPFDVRGHAKDSGASPSAASPSAPIPSPWPRPLPRNSRGQPVNAFSIRKTQKDHGIVKWVEGDIQPGEKVVVIDDVATTGGSTIKAIERARSEGLEVVRAVILVDRQEGGMDNIRSHVPDATAIITRDELVACWKKIKNRWTLPLFSCLYSYREREGTQKWQILVQAEAATILKPQA